MSTISYPVCPHCNSRLRGGWPSFGPAQVTCGYCGAVVATSLEGWNEGPFSGGLRKVRIILTELLAPTCMGYKDVFLRVILNLVWLTPTMLVPVFPLLRLTQMVRESVRYEKTKQPPQWKWLWHQVRK